jgi:hypothetical protein
VLAVVDFQPVAFFPNDQWIVFQHINTAVNILYDLINLLLVQFSVSSKELEPAVFGRFVNFDYAFLVLHEL